MLFLHCWRYISKKKWKKKDFFKTLSFHGLTKTYLIIRLSHSHSSLISTFTLEKSDSLGTKLLKLKRTLVNIHLEEVEVNIHQC